MYRENYARLRTYNFAEENRNKGKFQRERAISQSIISRKHKRDNRHAEEPMATRDPAHVEQ